MNRQNYQQVLNFLRIRHIEAPQHWLENQITMYLPSTTSCQSLPNISGLCDFILSKWLSVDLRDLQTKILPPNLHQLKLTTLQRSYVLQVNSIRDIGHSAYSQLCKIRKVDEVNLNVTDNKKNKSTWEPKGGRMLMLELTDGTQDISAMEYNYLSDLRLDLVPGTKILVTGPVECRRGVILLRAGSISVLGGKVDSLQIHNAPENILARAVGKEENANPDYGALEDRRLPNHKSEESFAATQKQLFPKRPAPSSNSNIPEAKRPIMSRPTSSAPLEFNEVDDDFLAAVEIPELLREGSQTQTNEDLLDDGNDDILFGALDDVEASIPESSKMPFTYLMKVLENRTNGIVTETFCVKGFISTITGKLEAVNGKWQLAAKINDGTAALDVSFNHEVLEKLIGCSPLQMKTLMKEGNSAKRSSILQCAKNSLISLNCLLHISWPLSCERPTVIRLEDVTEAHLAQVACR